MVQASEVDDMNLHDASGAIGGLAFRIFRALATAIPGRRISAFGNKADQIAGIYVINLDRQPNRWRRVMRELARFRAADGRVLTDLVIRLAAVDARDGRAVAATADVDPNYRIADQLFVQPDARLAATFDVDEPVRMTRQEIAVARSHIEVWKRIAEGDQQYAMVLEDDVWFRLGASAAISNGWRAAIDRCVTKGGPTLLYLSYSDAGNSAQREEVDEHLFRPVRGLWFLSGYVLSREGAAALLRTMPVVGPVDMWINYRFEELGALALNSPAILQRQEGSDNSYSMLPFLARAGIVDATAATVFRGRNGNSPVLVWVADGECESLAMALSMLGLRVRVIDPNDGAIDASELSDQLASFDALINARLTRAALAALFQRGRCSFIIEELAAQSHDIDAAALPAARTLVLAAKATWETLCSFLQIAVPAEDFPMGAPTSFRTFRAGRPETSSSQVLPPVGRPGLMDDSPWVLPPRPDWPRAPERTLVKTNLTPSADADLEAASPWFVSVAETFPGNLASFVHEAVSYGSTGSVIRFKGDASGSRPYRSGALASTRHFGHGRFEAEIKAAAGTGLITGFFLHRSGPRQEIDIELLGGDPRRMLVNVYFNPGEEGSSFSFGYRGTPCYVDLGFDSTLDFHLYSIDWRPDRITWSVDGMVVHERASWDPTPIPHLPMRLHANLWAPKSKELAGDVIKSALPAQAAFRNVSISVADHAGFYAPVHRPSMNEEVACEVAKGIS